MASNTHSKHLDVSEIVRKRNRADTALSSVSSTLPGRPSPQRQKRWPSVEVTSTRVLPPEEVETESDTEVKDHDSEEDEKEELASQGLASQELVSQELVSRPHTPSANMGISDHDDLNLDTPESLKTPGFTWNYEVWIGTYKIRSWGGEVEENTMLNIKDTIRNGAAEMTQWLQKGTAKYAAVLDTAGSIEAVLTAKPQRPPFKHTIKSISDWWSVEKQMKSWSDANGRDFFVQLKHKCDGVTVAEMKSQGKNVSVPRPQPRNALPSISCRDFACVRNPDYQDIEQPAPRAQLGRLESSSSQEILDLIRTELGGKAKRVSWIPGLAE